MLAAFDESNGEMFLQRVMAHKDNEFTDFYGGMQTASYGQGLFGKRKKITVRTFYIQFGFCEYLENRFGGRAIC
jgi:hypothetical protein